MAQTYELLLDEYLEFTRSPIRDRTQRTLDFAELWSNPDIGAMKFIATDVFVVGTKTMYARCFESGRLHEIGEFMIFIVRNRPHRHWRTEFWFYNTNPAHIIKERHHPHILTDENREIAGFKVGKLCIRDGHHGIYQSIRSGHISETVVRLVHVLRTYQPAPFLSIENWPLAGTETKK